MKNRLHFIAMITRRWFFVRGKKRLRTTTLLGSLGIGIGVTALIVVLSVINGFQLGYIDALLEVSSFHALVQEEASAPNTELIKTIQTQSEVLSVLPFLETEVLISNSYGSARPVKFRAIPQDFAALDQAFARTLKLDANVFKQVTQSKLPGLVLGSALAENLGLNVGDVIAVTVIHADEQNGIRGDKLAYEITALFTSDNFNFDYGLALADFSNSTRIFLPNVKHNYNYGIKLHDHFKDIAFISNMKGKLNVPIESWREYNRSFFGALRTEKTLMFFLVALIFIVVAVNIYQNFRRIVIERLEELALLKALGAAQSELKLIFVFNGCLIGISGALLGFGLGLLISYNINNIFSLFHIFSSQYFYINIIPIKIFPEEIITVTLLAFLASSLAALFAVGRLSTLKPAQVLRYE